MRLEDGEERVRGEVQLGWCLFEINMLLYLGGDVMASAEIRVGLRGADAGRLGGDVMMINCILHMKGDLFGQEINN